MDTIMNRESKNKNNRDNSNFNGTDDSYMMGDEELQIVEPADVRPYYGHGHSRLRRSSRRSGSGSGSGSGLREPSCLISIEQEEGSSSSPLSRSRRRSKNRTSMTMTTATDIRQSSFNSDDFDICKEYGYRYEYTEDYDDDDSYDDLQRLNGSSGEGEGTSQSLISKLISGGTTAISNVIEYNGNEDFDNDVAVDDDDDDYDHLRKRIWYKTYLLGKTYHPVNDYHSRRSDENNLFWLTYRCDFVEIKPYGLTSDAGWGCMLRSAQMLLAQTLRMHYMGRDWLAPKSTVKRREDKFVRNILTWFADYPYSGSGSGSNSDSASNDDDGDDDDDDNGACSWFSLHNMVAAGAAKYDVLPGEWFGPNSSCQVLRDLVELRFANSNQKSKSGTAGEEGSGSGDLKVYVTTGGTVYKSDLTSLMTNTEEEDDAITTTTTTATITSGDARSCKTMKRNGTAGGSVSTDKKLNKHNRRPEPSPLDHPLSDSFSAIHKAPTPKEEVWNASLLILIPLRLGLKKFDADNYKVPLAHMLSLPQSVGFLGGSPRHALWFYGANSDGEKVFGLDPHTVQRTCKRRILTKSELEHSSCHKRRHEILLTDEYLRSINCPYISTMDMSKIDPSLALGFYCRNHSDFESLCSSLKSAKENACSSGTTSSISTPSNKKKKYHELFTIADAKPDYAADVSSAMMDLMMNNGSPQHSRIGGMDDDDDDEYVLL